MYQRSYGVQKQNKIDHVCGVMRAGRERKRLAQDYTPPWLHRRRKKAAL